MDDLKRFIFSANQILPSILSFHFQTFVWINNFRVIHENGIYYFFVSQIRSPLTSTTEDYTIRHVKDSVEQWYELDESDGRIIVAMNYFRQALHFTSIGNAPQTMLAEIILNLAKSLEIIFSDNRDKFRKIACEVGLDSDFVENKLISIMCLRSKLGIAHVSTAPLSLSEKDIINKFAMRSFNNVQYTINFVAEKLKSKQFIIRNVSEELSKEEVNLVKSIEESLSFPDKTPL